VTQPDIEKAKNAKDGKKPKGPRRRSLRGYVDFNREVNPDAVALIDRFPPDDVDIDDETASVAQPDRVKRDVGQAERRELASEGRALPNLSYPVKTHQDAENALAHIRLGHGDVKEAKRMLRRVAREEGWSDILSALGGKTDKAMGNAVPHPDGASWTDRLSPSRVSGQAAPSVGDHNAAAGMADPMDPAGPKRLAMGHPDMRQSTTNVLPLFTTRTEADMFPRDLNGMSNGVPVALARLDAASASGMSGPPANPAARPADHIAPISALPANGGHGLADAQSHAVALKASDRVEIMRQAMYGPRQ